MQEYFTKLGQSALTAEGYEDGLFINPRPEGYGSRLVVRSFIHSVTWNCVHFYATTKARTRSPREYIAI